ncbi:MAG: hemerythrin domain-containing protein [Chloroflexi bacterium]|nr:hemerythrin domain-containing protein [Chloroflexota bacterium]
MQTTDALKNDHRVIERMLTILQVSARRLNSGENVPAQTFRDALDFIRNFADSCHHGKEEDVLYPHLEKLGVPKDGGPIAVMLMEHDEGRRYVKGLAEAIERYEKGDKAAARDVARNALSYAELLGQHIPKEDNILYPIADQVLPRADDAALMKAFEDQEERTIGHGKHEEYIQLVGKLEKDLGIG